MVFIMNICGGPRPGRDTGIGDQYTRAAFVLTLAKQALNYCYFAKVGAVNGTEYSVALKL